MENNDAKWDDLKQPKFDQLIEAAIEKFLADDGGSASKFALASGLCVYQSPNEDHVNHDLLLKKYPDGTSEIIHFSRDRDVKGDE